MKCARCGYHNLPGSAACGQCGTSAEAAGAGFAAAATLDTYPPRARARSLNDRLRLRRRGRRASAAPTRVSTPIAAWAVTMAALVPGAGHAAQGRVGEGGRLFGAASLLVALALWRIRDPVSDVVLIGLLLLVWHSVWDAARSAFLSAGDADTVRWIGSVRLALLAAAVVSGSLAAAWLPLSARFLFFVVNSDQAAPTFLNGDALVVRRSGAAPLRHGDIVVAAPDGGPLVERVLGLPGDRIDCAPGMLRVNGAPQGPRQMPLTAPGGAALPAFSLDVPQGQVCLLRRPVAGGYAPDEWVAPYVLVTADQVRGRVAGVYGPARRRRWIEKRKD